MKAVLGKSRKISILSATDAMNICLGYLSCWMFCGVSVCVCVTSLVSVWSVESSVINDNELYFLGTARLMEEIGQRE